MYQLNDYEVIQKGSYLKFILQVKEMKWEFEIFEVSE